MSTTERIELDVADGSTMPAHVARAGMGDHPAGGIIVFQEAFGVTDWIKDVVRRFADLGLTAIAPELYHRSGVSAVPYVEAGTNNSAAHRKAITDDGLLADATAAYAWLTEAQGIPAERIAVIGFCMGGRLAYLANAHLPLAAAISYYGGRIAPSLLALAPQQHGPGLYFWAGRDERIFAGERRAVSDALSAAEKVHAQVVFSDAEHGFFCDARPWCYNERAAHQAWPMTLAFLRNEGVIAPEMPPVPAT